MSSSTNPRKTLYNNVLCEAAERSEHPGLEPWLSQKGADCVLSQKGADCVSTRLPPSGPQGKSGMVVHACNPNPGDSVIDGVPASKPS